MLSGVEIFKFFVSDHLNEGIWSKGFLSCFKYGREQQK